MQLLFELLSEEMPAFMQKPVTEPLFQSVLEHLNNALQKELAGEYFVTPRRMGFYIDNLPEYIEQAAEEIRGPRLSASQSAIDGFMKKYGIQSIDMLEKSGEFYLLKKEAVSTSSEIMLKNILEEKLTTLVWPKSMRWGAHSMKWVRPLHSILCTLNGKVLPIQYGHIKAGDLTRGHRFMQGDFIKVSDYADYNKKLTAAYVEIFPDKRRKAIEQGLTAAAARMNIELIKDEKLLEEVAGLVEYPSVLIGKIDSKFMSLPEEVLITSLRVNQRYFMFRGKDGSIAPFFGIVSNMVCEDNSNIIKGNERVLAARLSDAKFFYQQDLSIKLIDRVNDLKKLSFNEKIGSVFDKVQSTKKLAVLIAKQLDYSDITKVERTVDLLKADLLTEMVKEFPELQGVIGYHYAIENGEEEDVAIAIKEHYKPQGPSDDTPNTKLGLIVALAEKIDTLNQMFAAGIKPTGSKDPYALRRAAIGINRICSENSIKLNFASLKIADDVIKFIESKA